MSELKRWNIEEGHDGTVLCCKDEHDKGAPCEYETLTAVDANRLVACIARQDHQLTTAQAEIEALRGRLREINNLVSLRWCNGAPTHSEMLEEVQQISRSVSGSAWILRKQAEAVEEIIDADPDSRAEDGAAMIRFDTVWDYAQRLRTQADEAGKAGGGDG